MNKKILYTTDNYNTIIKEAKKIVERKNKEGVYQKLLDETLDKIFKTELSNNEYKILAMYEILNKFNYVYKFYYSLLHFKITYIIITKLKSIIKVILRKIIY